MSEVLEECCDNCIHWKDLEHWTYNEDGTVDHVYKGDKCCTVFEDDGTVIHMEGVSPHADLCECYRRKY